MSAEAIGAYESAINNLNSARSRVDTVEGRHPATVKFCNTGDIKFPDTVMLTSGSYVNALDLPDGMEVARKVSEYQCAIETAKHCYEAIPAELRSAVSPPPSR
jgi:hypothetical protein